MLRTRMVLTTLILLAAFSSASAQTAPPGLLIYNAWVRPTAPEPAPGATPEPPLPATITGAYMTIENTSDSDYRLVAIADDFAEMSQLHAMTMDSKGVMRMNALDSLDIPAGETVLLASAGYHAMLMNVTRDLYPGDAVALTLTFADASSATFDVVVGALATDDPPDDDSLIAANAWGAPDEDGLFQAHVLLVNRGVETDTLPDAEGAVIFALPGIEEVESSVSETVNIMPGETHELTIPVPGLGSQPPSEAFPLTLTFQSGKTLTVAVPVAPSGAAS